MNTETDIFYHIHKIGENDELWQQGKTINTNTFEKNLFNSFYDSYNPFLKASESSTCVLTYSMIQDILDNISKGDSMDSSIIKGLVLSLRDLYKEFSIFMRETIFEEVRAKAYPSRPSRQKCIWACNYPALNYWINILGKDIPMEIYKIKTVDSNVFTTSNQFIPGNILNGNEIREKAKLYWKGITNLNAEDAEILIEGKILILSRIKKNEKGAMEEIID